ncbi:unnamed protein product [Phaeothamnion confervicola]
MSSSHLKKEVEAAVAAIMGNKEEWEKRNDALVKLHALILEQQGDAAAFNAELWRTLKEPLLYTLGDLRSALVKEACRVVELLSETTGDGMRPLLRELMPLLLATVGSANGVIKDHIDHCMQHIIKHTKFPRQLKDLVHEAQTTKSAPLREALSLYLTLILEHWPPASLDKETALLEAAIGALLEDASVRARGHARTAFFLFQERWPQRAERIRETILPRTAKMLADDPGGGGGCGGGAGAGAGTGGGGAGGSGTASKRPMTGIPRPVTGRSESRAMARRPSAEVAGGGGGGAAVNGKAAAQRVNTVPRSRAGTDDTDPSAATAAEPPVEVAEAPLLLSRGSARSISAESATGASSGGQAAAGGGAASAARGAVVFGAAPDGAEGGRAADDAGDEGDGNGGAMRDRVRIRVGQRVTALAHGKYHDAIVRHVGPTDFMPGHWVGMELSKPDGKNDGTLEGKRYFTCRPNYGLFVRPGAITEVFGSGDDEDAGGYAGCGAVDAAAAAITMPAVGATGKGKAARDVLLQVLRCTHACIQEDIKAVEEKLAFMATFEAMSQGGEAVSLYDVRRLEAAYRAFLRQDSARGDDCTRRLAGLLAAAQERLPLPLDGEEE